MQMRMMTAAEVGEEMRPVKVVGVLVGLAKGRDRKDRLMPRGMSYLVWRAQVCWMTVDW